MPYKEFTKKKRNVKGENCENYEKKRLTAAYIPPIYRKTRLFSFEKPVITVKSRVFL